jgi:DNA invertase Pin-like site-specific DNA recombinase
VIGAYLRVSTDHQDTASQERELRKWAEVQDASV